MKIGKGQQIQVPPMVVQPSPSSHTNSSLDQTAAGIEKDKQYYKDKFESHPSSQVIGRSVSTQMSQLNASPFSESSGSLARRTQIGDDNYNVGPGWWGQGITLARAQANLGSWSIAGTGADSRSKLEGPSATDSDNEPTQDDVTVAKGGTGADSYKIGVYGGANVGNAEARAYDLFYTGGSQAQIANFDAPDVGNGIGGGGGVQARADLVDADIGADLSGGSTKIGTEHIKNLVDASAMGQASVGVQGDAEGMAYVGNKGIGFGGGVSAFAGAQAGAYGQATIDGVGVGVLAQGWAGEGVKANLEVSYKNGKLTFNGGLGAALDLGGYVNIQASINFDQIGKELEGVAESGEKLGDKWEKRGGLAGKIAGDTVGTAEGVGKLAVSTGKAALNVTGKVIGGVGNGINDVAQDASKDITNVANDLLKKI